MLRLSSFSALRNIALASCVALAAAGAIAPAQAHGYKSFDVPGAAATAALAINDKGSIAGVWLDADSFEHGFVRAPDGTFQSFDVPGTGSGLEIGNINASGDIAGAYFDAGGMGHGFLRSSTGTITTFDDPKGAFGTEPAGIDGNGNVAGYYVTRKSDHGFLLAPDGTFTTVDVPGASDTQIFAIDAEGDVAGEYFDDRGGHGFVRAKEGAISSFDISECLTPILAVAVNSSGEAAGACARSDVRYSAFLRDAGGTVTRFDLGDKTNTGVMAIDAEGDVVGYFTSGGVYSSFLRTPDGQIVTSGFPKNSLAFGINKSGEIAGDYEDRQGVSHGFLLKR